MVLIDDFEADRFPIEYNQLSGNRMRNTICGNLTISCQLSSDLGMTAD